MANANKKNNQGAGPPQSSPPVEPSKQERPKTILDADVPEVAKSLDSVKTVEELNDLTRLEEAEDKRSDVLQLIAARRMELTTGNDPVMKQMQEQMAQMQEQMAASSAAMEKMQANNEKLMFDNQQLKNRIGDMQGAVLITNRAVLLKDLSAKEFSWLPHDFKKGDELYKYLGDEFEHHDGRRHIAMTKDPDGHGSYFAVPKNLLLWQDD